MPKYFTILNLFKISNVTIYREKIQSTTGFDPIVLKHELPHAKFRNQRLISKLNIIIYTFTTLYAISQGRGQRFA